MFHILTDLPSPFTQPFLKKISPEFDIRITHEPDNAALFKTALKDKPDILLLHYTPAITPALRTFIHSHIQDKHPLIWLTSTHKNITLDPLIASRIMGLLSAKPSALEIRTLLNAADALLHIPKPPRQLARIALLYEALKAMNSTFKLKKMGYNVIKIIQKLVKAEHIEIYTLNPDTGLLELIGHTPHTESGKLIQVGEGEIGKVQKTGRSKIHLNSKSPVILLPLKIKSKILGVLRASTPLSSSKVFTPTDVQLLKEIATQLAHTVQNADLFSTAEELAVLDPLTTLYNRSFFHTQLLEEIDKAKRNDYAVSLLMIDIDYFKSINDTYGHQVGDEVLKKISHIIQGTVRKTDYVARYGGEEMVVLLVGTNAEEAIKIAEKIRTRIEAILFYAVEIKPKSGESKHMLVEREMDGNYACLLFPLLTSPDSEHAKVERIWIESLWLKKIHRDIENPPIVNTERKLRIARVKITVSVGLSTFPNDFGQRHTLKLPKSTNEEDLLIYMSDKALYRAKKEGRNKLFTYKNVQELGKGKEQLEKEKSSITELMKRLKEFDPITYYHCLRVAKICLILSKQLQLSQEDTRLTVIGGLLHDIGKLAIPLSLINKPGPLTNEEYERMKTHTTEGAEILKQHPELHKYINSVKHHHERWEGYGYPEGIAATRIPLETRIVTVCDSFDAMHIPHCYKEGPQKNVQEITEELVDKADRMYDRKVVDALLKVLDHIRTVEPEPPVQWVHNV